MTTKTQTIEVDPASVFFFAIHGIRGGVEAMDAAIDAKDAEALTEAIEQLANASATAHKAIKKGALS